MKTAELASQALREIRAARDFYRTFDRFEESKQREHANTLLNHFLRIERVKERLEGREYIPAVLNYEYKGQTLGTLSDDVTRLFDNIKLAFEKDDIIPDKHRGIYGMTMLQTLQLNCVHVGRCHYTLTRRDIGKGMSEDAIGTIVVKDVYASASRLGAIMFRMSNGKFVSDERVDFLPLASPEAVALWTTTRQKRNAMLLRLYASDAILEEEIAMFSTNLRTYKTGLDFAELLIAEDTIAPTATCASAAISQISANRQAGNGTLSTLRQTTQRVSITSVSFAAAYLLEHWDTVANDPELEGIAFTPVAVGKALRDYVANPRLIGKNATGVTLIIKRVPDSDGAWLQNWRVRHKNRNNFRLIPKVPNSELSITRVALTTLKDMTIIASKHVRVSWPTVQSAVDNGYLDFQSPFEDRRGRLSFFCGGLPMYNRHFWRCLQLLRNLGLAPVEDTKFFGVPGTTKSITGGGASYDRMRAVYDARLTEILDTPYIMPIGGGPAPGDPNLRSFNALFRVYVSLGNDNLNRYALAETSAEEKAIIEENMETANTWLQGRIDAHELDITKANSTYDSVYLANRERVLRVLHESRPGAA